MSEAPAKPVKSVKRRWSAYVCPDCRMVFRIPMNHDGRGVVCPCCMRMLRIPKAGEEAPALSLVDMQRPRNSKRPF